MGQKLRHFRALMKKNWIIWKRTLIASICELVCPIILMSVLVMTRTLVNREEIAPQSNIDSQIFIAPMPQSLRSNGTASDNLTASFNEYSTLYKNFSDFANFDLSDNGPIANFIPTHCLEHRNTPKSPIIAYAGNDIYTLPLARDLQSLIKMMVEQIKKMTASGMG